MKPFRSITVLLGLGLALACGPKSVQDEERRVEAATEMVEDGGVSPFQARLAFKSPEAMAVQEAMAVPGAEGESRLQGAYQRYQGQWTFLLSFSPKPGARQDPQRPLALDIENNGGMWHDYDRNLQRLMFEMGGFIRLRTPDGKEIEPALVEFQRSFGMGLDRSFVVVFPKQRDGQAIRPPFQIQVRDFGQGTGRLEFDIKGAPGTMSLWRLKRLWKASNLNGQTKG